MQGTPPKILNNTKESLEPRDTLTISLNNNKLLVINGILTSLKKFKLNSREPLIVLKQLKPITKALKSSASYITFNFLNNNEKLKLIP